MMRFIACMFVLFTAVSTVSAQDSFMSLGAEVGTVNGATLLVWDLGTDVHTLEFSLGWAVSGENALQVDGARRWHFFDPEDKKYFLYVGYGARLKFEDDVRFGGASPCGINWVGKRGKREWFAEVMPILDFTPDVELRVDVTVGMRFYL